MLVSVHYKINILNAIYDSDLFHVAGSFRHSPISRSCILRRRVFKLLFLKHAYNIYNMTVHTMFIVYIKNKIST